MLARAARQAASAAFHQQSTGTRVLTALEKAKLVCWFEETNSFAQVARRYRAEFGMEPPHLEQVKKWHQRFLSTGSVVNGDSNGWEEAHSELGHHQHKHQEENAMNSSSVDPFGLEPEEPMKMANFR